MGLGGRTSLRCCRHWGTIWHEKGAAQEMRFRPAFQDVAIGHLLKEHFDLTPGELIFLPLGEDSWVYRATCTDGSAWLVRLKQDSRQEACEVSAWLHDHAGLNWVVAPCPSRTGRYEVPAGELWLTLAPWVDAPALMTRGLAAGDGEKIGQLLAQLHASAKQLPPSLRRRLPQETFCRHREAALKVLQAARQPWPADSIQAALAGWIGEKERLIYRVLRAAEGLGERLRKQQVSLVLCHADFHAANILVGEDGRWWVIDWDGLLLAPPERDLSFWYDSPVWEEVARAYGPRALPRADLLEYYALEWVVQEIADYGENIFYLPLCDEQKTDSLQAFQQLFAPGDVVERALYSRSAGAE